MNAVYMGADHGAVKAAVNNLSRITQQSHK